MADTKVTALDENTAPLLTDIAYIVDDPGGTPASQKVTFTNLQKILLDPSICNGRLTLESGVPVSTGDQSAATTLYFTPYKGDKIGLYDGSASWNIIAFAELSLDISGYTASKPYDIFAYNDSGSVALEGLVWTNTTTRATALTTQNGILVKTGATTRRYIGTIYINSSGGQTDDTLLKRYVWNYYNRVTRSMRVADTNSHNYTTAAYRSWNNDANVRVNFVVGVIEIPNFIFLQVVCESALVGIGYDATNATVNADTEVYSEATAVAKNASVFAHFPAVGLHFYQVVEYGIAGNTNSSASMTVSYQG